MKEDRDGKQEKSEYFPLVRVCIDIEIGREANLTGGTCPEQCHISINYMVFESLCIYILGKLIVFVASIATRSNKQRWETKIV